MFTTLLFASTLLTLAADKPILPKTNDPVLQRIFQRKIRFYDHKRAHQGDGGVHDSYHNISALSKENIGNRTDKPIEPFGNMNREAPWNVTGGTDKCDPSLVVKKFFDIPNKIKWEWIHVNKPNHFPSYEDAIEWKYPEDTVFGEILYIKDKSGKLWPFEVRTRNKRDGKWIPGVYRSVTSREEYDSLLDFPTKPNVVVKTMKAHTFKETAALDILPPLEEKLVKSLLSRPFKSVKGKVWIEKDSHIGWAPTTKESFHIVPKNYEGGFIEVSQKSCARCHSDTLKSVINFNPTRDISKSVDWYHLCRGSDGILSFNIFEDSCISSNGFVIPPVIKKIVK